ncbi:MULTISPECIES: 2-hydroxyacid dehydrogenase [Acinetobacter]|uniref:2-hydroxyacid dehydrogenase n=1 Tax=Acinetobacter faecalis TaxID=2665161 RepID=A0A6L6GD22_9GAMM|nr:MULTISPECIES: 2-hydroxyacid dehydrogenase [Acinetobacter]MDY6458983.1 2-hydroxyacid dehydrogenase [Acinetobacter faecalis]MDY6461576.1 2-hydroxyacid dehydrogenase [Acinetobacter faecalis]MDY6484151.1 2-hydroxyacid dehydrogenase [Acinetobacter faecalis]MDY6488960.1 2-hydroxyacid dehydrogenase [Acinetobacter faecalis]MDY6523788.1 2-hydroxyacid dehydrogenase [Acinetobacter faecalis]
MKAVFLDYVSLDQNDLNFKDLENIFDEWEIYPSTSSEQLLERIQNVDVIISNKVVVNAEAIQQCPNLKLILISATGTNNIDLVQAKKQGVVVCNCQAYGTSAVAQHTLMLMLNLATSFKQYERAVQNGDWNKASQFCLLDYPIIELEGKTLGILGYGELGKAVAKLAEAFGMKILVGALPNRPVQENRIPFNELLSQVDFLTLHCPLSTDTQNLIDAKAFDAMKHSAFLINCARGGIVNEQDLADALIAGKIAGAATDVLMVEPPKDGNVLLNSEIPNLLITPHSAWGSVDARQRIVQQMVENVEAFKKGQPIRQVNA